MNGPQTLSIGCTESKQDIRSFDAKNYRMNSHFISSESLHESVTSPYDESQKLPLKTKEKSASEISSDGGYASSSEEERTNEPNVAPEPESENNPALKEIIDKYHFDKLPADLKKIVLGANQGLPDDYNVPADVKPDWVDMKKFKLGQEFARKYFFGVNSSQMMGLFILFALPDGLETLIFSGNSATPFTAFRRYLSTVVRVSSWYDHDIWSKGNPGYRNIKAVKGMHLNVSKKMNSTPFEVLKDQVTLAGSSNKPPVWKTAVKDIIQEDFRTGCPFKSAKPIHNTIPGKIFINQLDMSTTQFGFVGLMVAYPEKFGAASATREELEAYLHLWRSIGYLLGMRDEFNFCAGTLDEVVERCRSVVEHWAKPNFQHLSEDWEHMSRVLTEGMSYVGSTSGGGISFEVSLLYMCWVLDVPAPRLYASLTWTRWFEFTSLKFLITEAVRVPGVLPVLNWFIRRAVAKAATMPAEQLTELESKEFDYQQLTNEVEIEEKKENSKGRMSRYPVFKLALGTLLGYYLFLT